MSRMQTSQILKRFFKQNENKILLEFKSRGFSFPLIFYFRNLRRYEKFHNNEKFPFKLSHKLNSWNLFSKILWKED